MWMLVCMLHFGLEKEGKKKRSLADIIRLMHLSFIFQALLFSDYGCFHH